MKKKLEADLISIAHRILKLKNKSDINQLYLETQKLYEKLAVLKFVDENFDTLKPTIAYSDIESQVETIFEKEDTAQAPIQEEEKTPIIAEEIPAAVVETIPEPEVTEETEQEPVIETPEEVIEEPTAETIVEPTVSAVEETIEEKIKRIEETVFEEKKETETAASLSFTTKSDLKPIPDFKPAFELTEEPKDEIKEEVKEVINTKPSPAQIMFEDLGINYADAQFVKVDSFEAVSPSASIPEFKETKTVETVVIEKAPEPKATTLNEKLGKGFHIDLNDRIAFTKNLFGNSTEDYSRVLNQLLTFDSYNEAVDFIENMVKPDYNDWEGKDDYAERFLGIIEKKFS
ncbi:hypothetical protein GKZ90_0020280 [Flavobacterium sp. MC2016-06]|uniref:hypothetical protein n=1 Tax=Flavobacterium sp. MC2016-06 TaxID=2676308 RepID=UPI0012BAD2F9|nr:hypothetical protein [Flavobacterium sp. MC2016-06]MBU3860931.1 hypothetical protein [Flavobacterium sp. MC2016-06]